MGKLTDTLTLEIVHFLRSHPGAGTQDVRDMRPDVSHNTISCTLTRLVREGVLEKEGGINRFYPAKWYVIESSDNEEARKLARDIYAEMTQLHHSVREEYLAEKLDELLTKTN